MFVAHADILHERITQVPRGWARSSLPQDGETITLQIGLALNNLDQMRANLMAVSSPSDRCYGHHMDREAVDAMVNPKPEAGEKVMGWLKSNGIKDMFNDGRTVHFSTSVRAADRLLSTRFRYFKSDGAVKLRTMDYSVPEDLEEHIDIIHPTTYFGPIHPVPITRLLESELAEASNTLRSSITKRQTTAPSCGTFITPSCLNELYNVRNYTAHSNSGSHLGFGSFLNQSARYEDLVRYQNHFGLPHQNFTKVFINDAANNQSASSRDQTEANLDVQQLVGVGGPLPITEFLTGGAPPFIPSLDLPTPEENTNEPYVPYYEFLLRQPNSALPQVITNSYGEAEQTVPLRYAHRTCNLIGLLGLRGITVLQSSGDTGVGAACQSNDGKKTPEFVGQFPSTCPWITGVGGTEGLNPEIAWRDSSGGFSDVWSRWDAPYAIKAVSNYLENEANQTALEQQRPYFNYHGRGFPDVSAHSGRPWYLVFSGNRMSRTGGASAASPVFAAIVGLLNDARFRADPPLPALGFLNPWLYSDGYKSLLDVTEGGSVGCTGINPQLGIFYNGSSIIPSASWNATKGWDPVTGLGVPDFQKMLAAALKLKKGRGCGIAKVLHEGSAERT
ncbi:subtilisin-like protein [Eremomyces bilateralis CBS 781.70]|uniref:tripeptidyl-peptidase II n=1 Tax=Eremomyces bilateralis CBS 781.70 TaxID=1392243 RepID=A0A6G1FR19_9PEZI|nr:subtilisin-like protein [Eremomyces bilateralis CBS 781.70]KAF1808285.1 subtilisin-like protein [Eremomyces bilateralis CBS 781.70]